MTMRERDELFVWECDKCGQSVTVEGDFWSCWGVVKRKGWVAQKDDGTWFHWCAACRKPSVDILARRVPFNSPPVAPPTIFDGTIFGGPVVAVPLIEIGGA
jgi:hypothetical protein